MADLSSAVNAHPMSPNSTYHKLSAALDAYVDNLPIQLEFSPNTLQVHFSTRSSSSYAIMHIALFLARITLERKCLPDLPFLSPRPIGPVDPPKPPTPDEEKFFMRSAERFMSSSRDMITVFSFLEDWSAKVESPFIISALERAARSGLYAFNFPWMDTKGYLTGVSRTDAEPMGTGEETRKSVEFIKALSKRWYFAKESYNKIVDMQAVVTERVEQFIRHDPDGRHLADKISRFTPNQTERTQLFSFLSPPTPKPSTTLATSQGRGPSSELDIHLAGTSSAAQEPVVGPERWMAVNTPMSAQQPTQSHKSDEGGSLDALAGFAAQQGKIGNGQDNYGSRESKMNEPSVKEEEQVQQGDDRRWIESGVASGNNWVNALEG